MAIQILLLLFGLVGTGSARNSVSLGSTVYIRACDRGKVMVPPPGTRLPANFTMQWILRAPRGKQIRLLLRELELRMVGRGGCQDALALKNGYPPFEESSQVICGAWDNTEVLGEYRMTLRMHVGTGSVIPREVGMHLEYSCADRKQENATAPCHRMFPCSASVKDYLRWTQCQPLSAKCDGIEQCHNGEDEQNCSGKSLFDPESSGLGSECPHKGLFECERQSCIPKQWVCDGKRDCDNGADEKKAMCRQLRTTAATALPLTVPTKSPKRNRRRCPRRKFLCPEEGVCIRKRYVCDGLKDCSRGEDEANCEARTTAPASTMKPTSAPKDPCSPKKFYCRSEGVCISKKFVCDKFEDCKEGEDEKNCDKPKKCGHKKFPPKGYWYWNLLVRSRGHKLCAAVLIDDRVALTAAHCARRCLHEGSNCEVVLSSRLRKKHKTVRVTKTALHPDFEWPAKKNDLALLRLESDLGKKARPLCLPFGDKFPDTECYIAGFGSARKNRLKQAVTTMLRSATCSRSSSLRRELVKSERCVSYPAQKLDVCDGELGAPLSCFDPQRKRWVLGGVATWEVRCSRARKFSVFQDLAPFQRWITSTTEAFKRI